MNNHRYGYEDFSTPEVESIHYKGVVRNRVTNNEVFSCTSTTYAEAKQAITHVLYNRGQQFVGEVIVVFDWV